MTPERRAQLTEAKRRQRARARAAGLCVICAKARATDGLVTCPDCNAARVTVRRISAEKLKSTVARVAKHDAKIPKTLTALERGTSQMTEKASAAVADAEKR